MGDQIEMVLAHKAIPMALALAGVKTGCQVEWDWVATPFHPSRFSQGSR